VLAVILFGLIYAVWAAADRRGVSLLDLLSSTALLEEVVGSWGAWGPLASVGLMVVHSFVPFPAEFLAVANGMVFGLWLGFLVTWTGAMLGALCAFALARWFGAMLIEPLLSPPKWARMRAWVESGGAGALLTARLIPVISFNLVNYAAGLLEVGWWRFIWTTAIGILPVTIASVLVGSHMLTAPWWIWPMLIGGAAALWLGQILSKRNKRTT
jgi:uncharacterized membrane protein YdjX (TVP38/TMEM64 family)